METPASLLTGKIAEDRIKLLFELFRKHPVHHVWKQFKEETGIEIRTSDLQEIYAAWYSEHTYAFKIQMRAVKKLDCWEKVEERIRKKSTKRLQILFITTGNRTNKIKANERTRLTKFKRPN